MDFNVCHLRGQDHYLLHDCCRGLKYRRMVDQRLGSGVVNLRRMDFPLALRRCQLGLYMPL